ncbi:LysR family transcriptional regulator [Brevundimonas sp.]|uniref:LysR family transcriptional regulator n=1 Tax=Brevundimonas sp. TaxID=1871086 RepID=UPI002FCBF153
MLKRAHIRQFLAVVDSGSFTQAAARVRITQPTLSVGIAELEKEVGSRLFIRDRKHVRITEAGARLLPIARQLEQGFRAAEALSDTTESHWPQLRLGMLQSVAGSMAQNIMQTLCLHYELELVEGPAHELRTMLASGRIDVALTLLRPEDIEAGALALRAEPYVMLVPTGHPLAGQTDVPPDAFGADVMIARRSCERLQDTSRFFTRNGVRPRFALRSDNDDLCIRMVAAGLGVTTAPLSLQIEGTQAVSIAGYDFQRTLGLIGASPEQADSMADIHALLAPAFI